MKSQSLAVETASEQSVPVDAPRENRTVLVLLCCLVGLVTLAWTAVLVWGLGWTVGLW
jgi:hypothetical protein